MTPADAYRERLLDLAADWMPLAALCAETGLAEADVVEALVRAREGGDARAVFVPGLDRAARRHRPPRDASPAAVARQGTSAEPGPAATPSSVEAEPQSRAAMPPPRPPVAPNGAECHEEGTNSASEGVKSPPPAAQARFIRTPPDPVVEAFGRDLVALLPKLRRQAMALTRDPDAAADLAQEAVARALRYRAHFEPGTNLAAWTATILRNCFFLQRRGRRARPHTAIDDVHPEVFARPASQFDAAVLAETQARIATLPAEMRETLVAIAVDGLSYEDLAASTGVTASTLRERVFRARRLLNGTDPRAAVPKVAPPDNLRERVIAAHRLHGVGAVARRLQISRHQVLVILAEAGEATRPPGRPARAAGRGDG